MSVKKKSVVKRPATTLGAGIGIGGIIPMLPPDWQPYAGAVMLLAGIVGPILAQFQAKPGA